MPLRCVGTLLAVAIALQASAQQPNIVFAFSDQHRWHSMGHTTMPALQTPNMDRMAQEGMAFDTCVSNYPVCSPYRAIVMTGQWPYQSGIIDNNIPLNEDTFTIGDAFKGAGYATGYVGKWHLGGQSAGPFGFDYSMIWSNTNTHFDESTFQSITGEVEKPEGYNATLMTDQAEAFIREHRVTPFFLMLSWNPPHSNYLDAPEDMLALYPEESLPYRENYVAPKGNEGRTLWQEDKADDRYRGYHAHVSAVDRELGRLMDLLEELNLRHNTIVVYSSDHGALLGSHGYGGKRQPYDESIRIPLLFWGGPIGIPGRRVAAPVGAIDIMPTLCELAAVPIPETCAGRSLSRTARYGVDLAPASQLIMHIAKENASHGENHPAPIFRGVRSATHTYALFPDGEEWLFENITDPYQMKNIAGDPSTRALKSQLRRELGLLLNDAEDGYLRRR